MRDAQESLSLLHAMFSTEHYGGYGVGVRCPLGCIGQGVHLGSAKTIHGKDNYEAKQIDMDVRGDVTTLVFWGECGHQWALVFGEHKGAVFANIRASD